MIGFRVEHAALRSVIRVKQEVQLSERLIRCIAAVESRCAHQLGAIGVVDTQCHVAGTHGQGLHRASVRRGGALLNHYQFRLSRNRGRHGHRGFTWHIHSESSPINITGKGDLIGLVRSSGGGSVLQYNAHYFPGAQ